MAAVTVAACVPFGDPDVPLAATRVDGAPALYVPLCEGEGVRRIYLTDSDDSDGEGLLLWELIAEGTPEPTERFVPGETPTGYREVVALDSVALEREVTGFAETTEGIELVGAIDFRSFSDSALYLDMEETSAEAMIDSRDC